MKHIGKLHPRRIVTILMGLCVLGILYCAFMLFLDSQEYVMGNATYQQLSQLEKTSEEKKEDPFTSIDFSYLKGINPDVVGWLNVKGTEIDYPVVQGTDNDFYLHHLFTGVANKLGAIFVDYRNHDDFSDKNTIIYGHNMKDGSMFSSLTKYEDQSNYDNCPTMMFYTPVGDFTIELFAGMVVDGNGESVRCDFKDDQDFQSYINSLRKSSTFESNTMVKTTDRIVTLCTCSYEFNNARYALFGKLTPVKQSVKNEVPSSGV